MDFEDWELETIMDGLVGLDRVKPQLEKLANEITISDLILPVPIVNLVRIDSVEFFGARSVACPG